MLGSIIGDIVGSVYEFRPVLHTDFVFLGKGVNYTDDTITAMAVADWVMNSKSLSHADLEEKLVNYAFAYPCPLGGYGARYRMWLCNTMSKRYPYGSFGNGSAMRVASIGWMFDSLEETERVAEISASITHDHPEGLKGAMATAAAIYMARTGCSKSQIKEYIQDKYEYDLDQTCDDIRKSPYKMHESCQETLPGALVAFLESTDFESSIRLAVSLARDSDTLACINGGIAEAFYKEIPTWMKDKAYSLLPPEFVKILSQLMSVSEYGAVVKQDPFCNMQRFLDAQGDVYGLALFELESGKKKGDWDIRLLFPSQENFRNSVEIEQYLAYPLLKARLHLACSALMKRPEIPISEKMTPEEVSIVRTSVALFNKVLEKLGQEELKLS